MTYIFAQALQYLKREVNIKYPPGAVSTIRVKKLGKGRGRGRYVGRDSGRYGGRDRVSVIFGHVRGRGYSPKL